MKHTILLSLIIGLTPPAFAASEVTINPPPVGSVSIAQGLEAWSRISEVTSHPRCANCHVGADNRPMWSGPSYGETRPHGMNINAGESRIGAETLLCSTCHTTKQTDWEAANETPHAAPRVNADWQLAPVEAAWFGKSTHDICAQLSNRETNGDRGYLELAEHLDHDVILHWAWNPGGTREPAPYSLQDHINDILLWGVAGMPCPAK